MKLEGEWEYSDREIAAPSQLSSEGFYLSHIYRDLVERDVIMRHGVRHKSALKEIARYLISNASSEFTYSKQGLCFISRLMFQLTRFSFKPKAQILSPKKLISYSFSPGEIPYWRDEKGEVDFIVRSGEMMTPIQITFSLEETHDREIRNLVRVSKALRVNRGIIIT